MMRKLFIYQLFTIVILTLMYSCADNEQNRPVDVVLATANGNVLTQSQVQMLVPDNVKNIDSVQFVQNYVDKWIRNQLMLEKAIENIDLKARASIESMVDDYRTSLFVYKYQQMYIEQNLDTLVLDSQIESHYNKYGVNFLLDSAAVRTVFVQLPKSMPENASVRRLIRSTKPDDAAKLEELCNKNAVAFDAGTAWHYLGSAMLRMPEGSIANQLAFAKGCKYIETHDSLYNYFFMVREFRDVNEQAPIELSKNKIKEILLNHRKNNLVRELEIQIYADAANKQRFINNVN